MARLRKVEETEAVEAAKNAFWQHGYGALGTRQLEAETGITRFTLQTAYGGKMALFDRALSSYLDDMETYLLPGMKDGTLETLALWFEYRCDAAKTPKAGRFGCLMIASINEFAGTSEVVNAHAARFRQLLYAAFVNALDRIDAAGGLAKTVDKPAAAQMLCAASIGLNVTIRAAADCAAGSEMAKGIGAVIRGWTAVHR